MSLVACAAPRASAVRKIPQHLDAKMKYVLVTGGVVSGLGKGVTASSIGVLLKNCGLRVTSIKIGKRTSRLGPSGSNLAAAES